MREAVRKQTGGGEVPYQLSVFALAVETLRRLRGAGCEPDAVAGHSLGEYAAAHAAGALSLEDGVRLVAGRDRLMTEASRELPGTMIALIGADPLAVADEVEGYPEEEGVVVAANFNTPRQTVLSGEKAAVQAVAERLKGRKVPLEVAGAFHSPLMRSASEGMEALLAEVDISEPRIPMVSGVDGAILSSVDDMRLALRTQMLAPVRWVAVVERMAGLGVEEMVEAGDGTLVRMLRDFRNVKIQGIKAKEVLG